MFYGFMAWTYWRRGGDILSRLVMWLMILVCAECLKDVFFIIDESYLQPSTRRLLSAIDMVSLPFYGLIMVALLKPGKPTRRMVLVHGVPFVLLSIVYIISRCDVVYTINVIFSALYGSVYLLWTPMTIPKYHEQLMTKFSYSENIKLNWLLYMHYSFVLLLLLWIADCYAVSLITETAYLFSSVVVFVALLYFLSRHESVLEEFVEDSAVDVEISKQDDLASNSLGPKIESYFQQEKAFLNPKLRLSDVVKAVGSNRSYVSNYFNQDLNTTFFDYVNGLRVEYACELLSSTSDSVDVVAMNSGFNSPSTFYRVFQQVKGCTPANYRGGC